MCWCFIVFFAFLFCVGFVLFFLKEEELCLYLLGSAKHWSLQFYLYGTASTVSAAAS